MKQQCKKCNKELGFFNFKYKLADSVICSTCNSLLKSNGMKDFQLKLNKFKFKDYDSWLTKKMDMCQKFEEEDSVGEILKIDYSHKFVVFDNIMYSFENIEKVDLILKHQQISNTNSTSKTKKGLGRAIMGGLLFGGVGAITGGLTGKSKIKTNTQTTSEEICSFAKISISLKDYYGFIYSIELNPNDYHEIANAHCSDIEEYAYRIKNKFDKILETRLRSEQTAPTKLIYCRYCGTKNEQGFKCLNCGANLNE